MAETQPTWNGTPLGKGCNRVATQWAWEQGPTLFGLGMHRGERDALVALAYHSGLNGSNKAWPTLKRIAAQTGMKVSGVMKSLRLLETAGVIKTTRQTGQHNVYQITPETDSHRWMSPLLSEAAQCTESTSALSERVYSAKVTSELSEAVPEHSGKRASVLGASEQEYVAGAHDQEKETGATDRLVVGRSASGQFHQEINPDSHDDRNPAQRVTQSIELKPTGKHVDQPQATKPVNPTEELAVFFYILVGSPAREANAAKTVWAGTLKSLIEQYGIETAKVVLIWAYENAFWRDYLPQKYGDSAKFAVKKFATWLDQRANEAERKTKNPAQARSTSSSVQSQPKKSDPTLGGLINQPI